MPKRTTSRFHIYFSSCRDLSVLAFSPFHELETESVQINPELETSNFQESRSTHSQEESDNDDSSKKTCIICDKARRYLKGRSQTLFLCGSKQIIDSLVSTAKALNYQALVKKINSALEKNQPIYNHNICKRNYIHDFNKITKDTSTNKKSWHLK